MIRAIVALIALSCGCAVLRADVVLLGDSIVADIREPFYGWGELLPDYLPEEQILNRAISGASSRSYYAAYWTRAGWPFTDATRDLVEHGDFVLIQFGHNDIPTGPPNAAVQDLDEYKMWLTTLVDEALELGGLPIFVTPPEGWAHRRSGAIGPIVQRQGHADAMKDVAAAVNAPFIDLHAYSVEQFANRTEEQAIADFEAVDPETMEPTGDKTHTSENGANVWAEFVSSQFPEAALTSFAGRYPGDFNQDGITDMGDFLILSSNFNESLTVPESFEYGDGNLDGTVNLADFFVFRREFQSTAVSTEPVPEPEMDWSVIAYLIAFLGLRRNARF